MAPLEVVIRDPKLTAEDILIKFAAAGVSLAIKAALLVMIIPPALTVFGIKANPNFGEALLIVLGVALVMPLRKNPSLTSSDKNRYLKENK